MDFRALELIDVSVERALLFTYPAMIVGWQAFTQRRLPRPAVLLALAATYGGILLVVGGFDAALWRQNLFGALLVLTCAACMACYFLLGERSIARAGQQWFRAGGAQRGRRIRAGRRSWLSRPLTAVTSLDAHDWLLMVALAVLCMFLPTLFQAGAISRIGAERGALASTIGPPAALLLGVLLLGERPDALAAAGHRADRGRNRADGARRPACAGGSCRAPASRAQQSRPRALPPSSAARAGLVSIRISVMALRSAAGMRAEIPRGVLALQHLDDARIDVVQRVLRQAVELLRIDHGSSAGSASAAWSRSSSRRLRPCESFGPSFAKRAAKPLPPSMRCP